MRFIYQIAKDIKLDWREQPVHVEECREELRNLL